MQTAAGGPIHYSRTMTTDNLSKAANYVGNYVLKGLGAFGKIMTAPFVQQGPTSATIYKSKKQLAKEKEIEQKSEEQLGKAMTWASPLNYGAALATGNGLNARKGEEEVASWSPAWQALGRAAELYVGPKAVKGVKAAPKAVVNTAAKVGVKPAKAAVVAREINKGIKQNTKNGRIEVTENYFNSPDKWYRITETPEKYGIMEQGKNVTTHDAPQTHGTINGWRSSILRAPITKSSEGFIKRPQKIELGIRRKNGQAHGNTSQAAKGKLWGGTTSGSNLFPEGIIEGQAPSMINYGLDRTNFVITPWEQVPNGGRVGFHTGEMPMSNLGWFQRTNKGTYTYEPIIPEKRISYQPKLQQEPSTSLAFFERKPSKNSIVGTSQDYGMKDSKGINFIKQFFAQQRINGKEYTLEGLKDAKNVQQGLPEYIQSYLNQNTIERAVRAMRKNGYSEREIQQYVDKVNEVMNKVKVGMYSDQEYNAAGAQDFGGFYNSDTNFISINKDAQLTKPAFTPNYIMKHEGRHLIDYNTSMTDDVINILEKAYDKDFLEIPKHEDAGSLKNYQHMDRERVTTNRDAREVLLSNLEKHSGEFQNQTKFAQTSFGKNKDMVDFQNELIQYAEPEDIINAVENSNGYGKKYISYLKKNNKLTSTKIEQLRQAMIHVPSYLLPITGGYTLYNLFNQPQLQYQKQGGKMNILEFLKNGSGIHIKEKNKGKFTSYCGGKVTDKCIQKGKNSSNPVIRKRATFADNARHFKHRLGGSIVEAFKLRRQILNSLNNMINV